jgi:hypothetical protein
LSAVEERHRRAIYLWLPRAQQFECAPSLSFDVVTGRGKLSITSLKAA